MLRPLAETNVAPGVVVSSDLSALALEAAGYELVDRPPPDIAGAVSGWARLMTTDARTSWPNLSDTVSAAGSRFMEFMFELFPPIAVGDYTEVLANRHRLAHAWSLYQQDVPIVLAPIYTGTAFGPGFDISGLNAASTILDGLRFTVAVNYLGLPSVAVPAGVVGGVPHGV